MTVSFPIRIELPVQWGELDAFHHVNNTSYLRWCESARIAYFAAIGIAIELETKREAPRPILARAAIDYRAPVTFPDTITVEASVPSFGTTSFVMKYRISSKAQNRVVADGDSVIVLLDEHDAKLPIPPALRARIDALEGRA